MDVMQRLIDAGAVIRDRHFVYTSGRHGEGYINMDPMLPNIRFMMALGRTLTYPFTGNFDTVATPATGGIVLAQHAAAAVALISEGRLAPAAVWADKQGDGSFAFERDGFAKHLRGKRVLVVEDLLNTAGSVAKVIEQVQILGGEVVGVSVVCNRGTMTAEGLGVPNLLALSEVSMTVMEPEECTLCAEEVSVVEDIGHGAKFLADNPGYTGGSVRLLEAA